MIPLGNLTFTRIGYYSNNTFVALTSAGYGYDNNGNCVAVTNGMGVVTRYLFRWPEPHYCDDQRVWHC